MTRLTGWMYPHVKDEGNLEGPNDPYMYVSMSERAEIDILHEIMCIHSR